MLAQLSGCSLLTDVRHSGCLRSAEASGTTTDSGLNVCLQAPVSVGAGEAFQIRLRVENPTGQDQTITTGGSCLVHLAVLDTEGENTGFKGTNYGCLGVVTNHLIPAHDAIESVHDAQAVIRHPEGNTPAAPADYLLQAKIISEEHIVIERDLVVRP